MDDELYVSIPADYDNSFNYDDTFLPAVNTYVYTPNPQTPTVVNWSSRLADKLFGAVEVNLDNMTAQARLQDARNQQNMQFVQHGGVGFLPASAQSFITRNVSTITTLLIMLVVSFVAVTFFRR